MAFDGIWMMDFDGICMYLIDFDCICMILYVFVG